MAAPTLALTFASMQLRVAEMLGIADYSAGAAAVPTDPHDLDLVKRLVNDGYRRYVNSNAGKWDFLAPLISVTFTTTAGATNVSADTARYYMPAGFFGEFLSPFTYPQSGPRMSIETVSEDAIRIMQASSEQTGDPAYVAIRPLADSLANSDKVRFEAVFYPTPSTVYTVTARGRIYPNQLSSGTDVTVCGFQHDEGVLAAAYAEAERHRDGVFGKHHKYFEEVVLPRMIQMDARSKAKPLGDYGDRSDDRAYAGRPYTGVDTYNGVAV